MFSKEQIVYFLFSPIINLKLIIKENYIKVERRNSP